VGLYWVPGHAELRRYEIVDKLARDGSVQKFVEPEPSAGTSKQNIRRKVNPWMDNRHLVLWFGPCSTQKQALELVLFPNLVTKTRLLSFNRTQSRVLIGLLTGHNNLRRYLYVMGLSNNSICREYDTEDETLVHVLCACEARASLRHLYLGLFFLDPEDIRKIIIGAIWNFVKGTGLL
jgi:hypothetical protein